MGSTGPLSGLFDAEAGPGLYHCIVRTDEDLASLAVKSGMQCYWEFAIGTGAAEPPCAAQHGTAATPAPVVPGEGNCNGHVQPPPYTSQQPTKLVGSYDAGTDTLTEVGCFADLGGALGPNIAVKVTVPNALAQNGGVGSSSSGTMGFYFGETNATCTNAQTGIAPAGAGWPLPLSLTRRATTRDFDGDGCTDMDELWQDKAGSVSKCGDDPWNPYDPTTGSPDVSGSYDMVLRLVRADVGAPGFYYECKADIQQSGKNLTTRILCYIDSAAVTVNPQVANCAVNPGPTCSTASTNNCPPAAPKFCGDGLPGAAPPGCDDTAATCATLAGQGAGCPSLPCNVSQYQFADIDHQETVLTGTLDNATNTINLSGCFIADPPEGDGFGPLGNIYRQLTIDAHTGIGTGTEYWAESHANCIAGTPAGSPIQVPVSAVRQAPGNKAGGCSQNGSPPGTAIGYTGCRDSDGDGCPDKRELADTAGGTGTGGGLRDPWNRWDYFNPEKVNTPHQQTVADILYVIGKYGKNQGNALYTIDADRTALIGGNVWNLGPPDGQQTVADILAAVKQFSQNC